MRFIWLLLICTVVQAQDSKIPVQLSDMLRIKTAGNITVTKDGSKAAFTVTSIEPDEQNRLDHRYVTQIYMLTMGQNSVPVQLTRARENATQPAWSPDGKQLAFVRSAEGKPQVFLLSMSGGDPVQLTRSRWGASAPRWSPDGSRILYAVTIPFADLLSDSTVNASRALPLWPSEKPGVAAGMPFRSSQSKPNPDGSPEEVQAYLQKNEEDRKAIVLNRINFQNESNISSDLSFTHYFLMDAQPGATPRMITGGFYGFGEAAFTPDGRSVILTADVDSLENPERSLENEIYMVDTTGRNMRMLLGENNRSYFGPTVSPDGRWMVFRHAPTTGVQNAVLSIMPFGGSAREAQSIPFDRVVSNPAWSPDGKYLYFTAQSGGGVPLFRLSVDTRRVEQLGSTDEGITSFGLTREGLLFARTAPANPSELFSSDLSMQSVRQVSRLNDWVSRRQLSFPQKASFTNDKGMTVDYWVMKPAGFAAGKKYPLLLEIHGGPSAMWGPGEASMWHEFQYFTGKGYGVVYANPRGSGGYGTPFLRGNVEDWSRGPASDVLTALDKAVALGWADTGKLFITGGSYAGYLVAWIIAHDKRFAAACSQRGVYDLATFFGEGNAWRLVPNYFGGYPWEPKVREMLRRESPFSYVDRITTPYIIFHGGNDRRTGFVQGEMMYRSLKVLGRPVEYVVHPGATHEITRSGDNRQRMDQMLRTYEFFQRWMR